MRAIIAALALVAGIAHAAEPTYTVGLHVYTHHPEPGIEDDTSAWAGEKKLWNDNTLGAYAGVRLGDSKWSAVGGAYCNSFSRPERNVAVHRRSDGSTFKRYASVQQSKCNVTKYLGAQWETQVYGPVRAGVALLMVHGYDDNVKQQLRIGGARVLPMPLPSLAVGPVRLALVGKDELHLALEHRF